MNSLLEIYCDMSSELLYVVAVRFGEILRRFVGNDRLHLQEDVRKSFLNDGWI